MKATSVFVIIILTVALLLTSCQNQSEPYDVLIEKIDQKNNVNIDTTGYEKYSSTSKEYENLNAIKEKKEIILNQTYTLKYKNSLSSDSYSLNLDIYYDETELIEFSYSSSTGNLVGILTENDEKPLVSYDKTLDNTDDYISWIKDTAKAILSTDMEDYALYGCTTYYKDGSTTNSFQLDSVDKKVSFYSFTFVKYVNGYSTGDFFRISANSQGSIDMIKHWEQPLDMLSKVSVDEEKLNRTIRKVVADLTPALLLKEYSVKEMQLKSIKGKPYMEYTLKLTYRSLTGYDYSSLVSVAIALHSSDTKNP
jgi:hypothetical protein